MGVVLDLLKPEIEKTIKGLGKKQFEPDPIADPYYSKITSVMSSAYKRHGYILERATLEALKQCPHFEVWRDPKFQIAAAVGHIVEGGIADPEKLIGASCLYSSPGTRALQIDAFVFNKNTRILGAYEIKRGGGLHDSGKRRSMLKDTLSVQILLKSYGKERGYDSENAFSHIIFYYGECSIPKPFGLAGDEIDKHFEWPVFGAVDEVNQYFRIRLAPILDAITA